MSSSFNLKSKLYSGKCVFGTWNTLGSLKLTEVISSSGLDFQIIDYEHGPFDISTTYQYVCATSRFGNCSTICRLPHGSFWALGQILDQGAHGFIIPQISTLEEVHQVIQFAEYPPTGSRGFSPYTSACNYTKTNLAEYNTRIQHEILKIIIIETKEAYDLLDQILDLGYFDVFYFGAYDLSVAFGLNGDIKSPTLQSLILDGLNLVKSRRKLVGGYVPMSFEDVDGLLSIGMTFITYQVDSVLVKSNYESLLARFRSFS